MTKIEELGKIARDLASALYSNDGELGCSQPTPCLITEVERPLTPAEKTEGFVRRPFYAYDTSRLCASCRAYWFAEMAAQQLHEMRGWQIRAEAEEGKND